MQPQMLNLFLSRFTGWAAVVQAITKYKHDLSISNQILTVLGECLRLYPRSHGWAHDHPPFASAYVSTLFTISQVPFSVSSFLSVLARRTSATEKAGSFGLPSRYTVALSEH